MTDVEVNFEPTFTRQELVTIVLALEEFRDTGVPELAERVNGVLRGSGDAFRLADVNADASRG